MLTDSIVRLIPGVISDETSALSDSYQDNLIAPPVYRSSTVYPFATVVAERYGRASSKPTPKIESTGSGVSTSCSKVQEMQADRTQSTVLHQDCFYRQF